MIDTRVVEDVLDRRADFVVRETLTISSTVACTIGKVMRADFADGDAVGKDVDAIDADPPSAAATGYIASAPTGSTPIARTDGRRALT